MSQNSTLFGVMLGAAIVGTTLLVRDALQDPQTAAAVRGKMEAGYHKVKNKVSEGAALVREKIQDGYTAVREKASEAGTNIRAAAQQDKTVQKIKKTVKDIRRAAEPAESYFAEAEEAERARSGGNDAETVVEVEAGIRPAEP